LLWVGVSGFAAAGAQVGLFPPTPSDCGWVVLNGAVSVEGNSTDSPVVTIDWGDGTRTSGGLPTPHQYRRNGEFSIRATAGSPDGTRATASVGVSVTTAGGRNCEGVPGVVLLPGSPETGECGRVRIDGGAFELASGPVALSWDWGDGTTETGGFPRAHRFLRNGTFRVSLSAVSSSGARAHRAISVPVSNAGQGACRAGETVTLLAGTPSQESCGAVMLPGTVSTTSGFIEEVRFDWGDGVLTRGTFPGFHRYTVNGRKSVRITALTSFGDERTATVPLLVQGASEGPCDDGPTLTLLPGTPVVGDCGEVEVPGTASASVGDLLPLGWDWGDGTQSVGGFPGHHRYLRAGSFVVSVTAQSSMGDRRSTTLVVEVPATSAGGCTAALGLRVIPGAPAYGPCGAVSIPGVTESHLGVVTNLFWIWGDGTSGWSQFPAFHQYSKPGTYRVTAEAWTSSGDRSLAAVVASVGPFSGCTDASLIALELEAPVVTAGGHVMLSGRAAARFGSVQGIEIHWGDGTVAPGGFPASHTYASDGVYVATVRVVLSTGQSALGYTTLVVTGTPGVAPAVVMAGAPRPGGVALGIEAALEAGLRVDVSTDLRVWRAVSRVEELPGDAATGAVFLRVQPPAAR
jgi:hypothetical protein